MLGSLRFRLWLTYAFVVGVVITIAGLTVAFYLWRNPINDRRENQRIRWISSLVIQRHAYLNIPDVSLLSKRLDALAEQVDKSLGVRFVLFDGIGNILVDSRGDSLPDLPDWEKIIQESKEEIPSIRDDGGRTWLYHLTPFENDQTLMLAVPRQRIPVFSIIREDFLTPFLRGVIIALILSLLFAFWISYWITAPLQRLSNAAHAISAGEYKEVKPSGPREVQAVTKAFNEMSERVRSNQRSQRDFVANVSHDLKTPLTSIQGFAQAIVDGTAEDPIAAKKSAQVIYNEAERMNRMVVDLLELARLDAGSMGFKRQAVNLEELINHVVDKFKPQAQKRAIVFQVKISSHQENSAFPVIIGDADRLDQVFSNLVDNALKYTPSYGQVEVGARSIGNWIEIWVADSGPGIPPAELDRIFERFYQLDKSRPGGERRGIGLGLAIAREIILNHGGKIQAYNRSGNDSQKKSSTDIPSLGHGSVFLVRLPLALPDDSTLVSKKPKTELDKSDD